MTILGVTGRREIPRGLPWIDVNKKIWAEIDKIKPACVLSGVALGTDQFAANIALSVHIPVIAVVPFAGQEATWGVADKNRYHHILKLCEFVHVVCEGGYNGPQDNWKFQARNEVIVDNCDLLLAVWDGVEKGGTWNCIKYARGVGREIRYIKV